jgi:hypothetical protein
MSDRLDYEATLRALQGLVGSLVLVTVGDGTFVGASFVGPLHSAEEIDWAEQLHLTGHRGEGGATGAALLFAVGSEDMPSRASAFVVSEDGFDSGSWNPSERYVAFKSGGLLISVQGLVE